MVATKEEIIEALKEMSLLEASELVKMIEEEFGVSCETPETAAHQAPLSLGFSRQEHWSGLPFPFQCMRVKSESEVSQSCPTLCDPRDGSPPGSPVPGILQARTLEWVAISFSSGKT